MSLDFVFSIRSSRRAVVVAGTLAFLAWCVALDVQAQAPTAAAKLTPGRVKEIVANLDRSDADRTNDVRRKPAEMLAFIDIVPGMVAVDLSTGGGYTTELLARAVGPTGRVYGQSPNPAATARLAGRSKNPAAGNMIAVVQKFEEPFPPEASKDAVDLVTIMFNYHDLGHMGVDRARMNKAVYTALKPGGMYVIADHSGRPGAGISESGTLHRVEEAFLRKEVEAAGFRFVAEGGFLRNPADPRDKETPDPPMPKDEFVLKFVKP
jgi:predicted methyltransferase